MDSLKNLETFFEILGLALVCRLAVRASELVSTQFSQFATGVSF